MARRPRSQDSNPKLEVQPFYIQYSNQNRIWIMSWQDFSMCPQNWGCSDRTGPVGPKGQLDVSLSQLCVDFPASPKTFEQTSNWHRNSTTLAGSKSISCVYQDVWKDAACVVCLALIFVISSLFSSNKVTSIGSDHVSSAPTESLIQLWGWLA